MASVLMRPRLRINGRRGAFQLLFAFIYVFVGVSFITAPAASSRTAALGYLEALGIPIGPLAALWIVSAGLATVSAFYCRPRDWFGFAALVFAPAVWGALFAFGVILGGPILGIVSAAIYWVFAATSMIVSGMQGESDRDKRAIREP